MKWWTVISDAQLADTSTFLDDLDSDAVMKTNYLVSSATISKRQIAAVDENVWPPPSGDEGTGTGRTTAAAGVMGVVAVLVAAAFAM